MKEFQATPDSLFVDAELCRSEIQDLAGNTVEIRKAGGQNRTKDRFRFDIGSLDVSAAPGIVNRLNPLLSTTSEGRKWLATLLVKYQEIGRSSAVRRPLGLRKLRRSRPPVSPS